MVIFSVTPADDPSSSIFEPTIEDSDTVGDPVIPAEASDIGNGPAAADVAGEAVEVAAALSSHPDSRAGHVYVTRRADEVAGCRLESSAYGEIPGSEMRVRPV